MSVPRERALPRQTLIDWLALAALLALGCLGPGADVPGRGGSAASAPAPGGALQLAAAPAMPE